MEENSSHEILVDHLFRYEAGKMIAVLTRLFGMHNLSMAEDVVQEAFLKAIQTWKFNSIPENPSAWLMQVAKNKALDILTECFPDRKVIGIDSTDIIWGLGSFHCLSQQEPEM